MDYTSAFEVYCWFNGPAYLEQDDNAMIAWAIAKCNEHGIDY